MLNPLRSEDEAFRAAALRARVVCVIVLIVVFVARSC